MHTARNMGSVPPWVTAVQIDLDPSFLAVSGGCAMSAKLFVLLQLRYIVEVGAPIKSVGSRPREPGPNLGPHPPTPQLRLGAGPSQTYKSAVNHRGGLPKGGA